MQYTELNLRDGKPYSAQFDDIYFSSDDNGSLPGVDEFQHVFFSNNGLPRRWHGADRFTIAELGLGSALNCLLTIKEWLSYSEAQQPGTGSSTGKCPVLHYIAIERYPFSAASIRQLLSGYPELASLCEELLQDYPPAVEGSHTRHLFDGRVIIHFRFMDVLDALKNNDYGVDAWYLDGFSPAKNAAMWTQEVFDLVASNSHAGTTCSTYTAAGHVRRGLSAAGYEVDKVKGHAGKREMLRASFAADGMTELRFADSPWFIAPNSDIVGSRQATVIGAGIAGLSVAYSLVQRGWQVTIIDQHEDVAQETSANPAAIVYPRLSVSDTVDTRFYVNAFCHSLYRMRQLQRQATTRFWFETGLRQTFDASRLGSIIRDYAFDSDFIRHCADELEMGEVLASIDHAGVVLPPILTTTMRRVCGDRLDYKRSTIDEIRYRDGAWQCLCGGEVVEHSAYLVLATGSRSPDLGVEVAFELSSVSGQIAVLDANAESQRLDSAYNIGKYLTPSIDDRHYLGASYHAGVDLDVSDEVNEELLAVIGDRWPQMFRRDDVSGVWRGVRATTPDRVPIVGAVPDADFYREYYADIRDGNQRKSYPAARYHEGLYVTLGHGSRGFTSSFLAADIIVAQIEGEPSLVDRQVLNYLNPSRFIVNKLKRS